MTRRNWLFASSFVSDRRAFLLSGASIAVLPWASKITLGAIHRSPRFDTNPFQLGVTSGDPTSNGVVLWTRLATQPTEPNAGMRPENYEVAWELSRDEAMTQIVAKGTSVASPQLGHSVHVEVDGLEPNRWYWYRFHCGEATSPVGRTRTMPSRESLPDELKFAFASCQHFETGLYTAYQHMAKEDLDLIIHLGDYIYEGAGQDKRLRKHIGPEIVTLDDYRTRYAQYKSDPHLIAAHQSAPWLVTWDDHEFDNNYANLISEESNVSPEVFSLRRAAAYQAYYENMPLRSSSIPRAHDMQLYRRMHFGRLAQIEMLDTRQYRSDQPNGDGSKPIVGDALSPTTTMLGTVQENWLQQGMLESVSEWNVLAQQVMMARADRAPGEDKRFSMDQWSGYDVARTRLLEFVASSNRKNTVVLTGDIHSNWANNLKVNFDDERSPTVATEFVGTSISSGGNGTQTPKGLDTLLSENPFVKFHNQERGYVRCKVGRKNWQTDFQVVEYVDKPDSPLRTRASFIVEHNRPGVERLG
jgi:alkaline phosphatase D